MKNGDKPINSIRHNNGHLFTLGDSGEEWLNQVDALIGLTKREYFAAMAMQGLLSNVNGLNTLRVNGCKTLEEFSVKMADDILRELEK